MQASKKTGLAASTSAGPAAALRTKASSTVKHHWAATFPALTPIETDGGDWQQVLCVPVHRVVFMAKCAYFSTLLRTAVGHSSAVVITEYAGSREDVQAILAAAECVYTDKMPVSNAMDADCDGEGCLEISTQLQKNIMALEVSCGHGSVTQGKNLNHTVIVHNLDCCGINLNTHLNLNLNSILNLNLKT